MLTKTTPKAQLLKSKQAVIQIKQQQSQRTNELRQRGGDIPKLTIMQLKDDPVISTYVRAKQRYGEAIGVETVVYRIDQSGAKNMLATLNEDDNVHGIIVQLPIFDTTQTEEILESVALAKDVDGLRKNSPFTPATPQAIMRLLKHYDIGLADKQLVVVGRGALVGAPLLRLLDQQGITYESLDKNTENNTARLKQADVIVTAAGSPGLIKPEDIKTNAVVVDAGTATAKGKTVGDVDPAAYQRADITITPRRGGVGPLTVCELFENVLTAYERQEQQS